MVNSITILINNSSDAFAMVTELKESGLIANRDFTWSYQPRITSVFDYMLNDVVDSPSVTFCFMDSKLLSFYQLKWQ